MLLLGEPLTQAELNQMVLEADSNGDGFIDFSEFSALMKNMAMFKIETNERINI